MATASTTALTDQNIKWADNDGDGRADVAGLVDPAAELGAGQLEHA